MKIRTGRTQKNDTAEKEDVDGKKSTDAARGRMPCAVETEPGVFQLPLAPCADVNEASEDGREPSREAAAAGTPDEKTAGDAAAGVRGDAETSWSETGETSETRASPVGSSRPGDAHSASGGVPDAPGNAEKANAPMDRAECIRLASKADIVEWCRQNNIPLTAEKKFFRHGDHDTLIMKGRWWMRRDRGKGILRRYDKGGLIQYLEEYEGIGMEEAVQRILKKESPGTELPERRTGFERKDRDRAPLRKRMDRARVRGRTRPSRGGWHP